ncbi:MAG: TetR/AcrR family transcriptional regulator [Treponema sp.]|nr:TetR/AcrR family transcriptional regulator [Treponema sp.]
MQADREDKKREEILDRATALFFERGISSLSMEAIAAGIGISKATLYKYFPGKEILGGAAIARRIDLLVARLDALDASSNANYPQRFQASFHAIDETIRPAIPVFMRDIMNDAPWLWAKIQSLRAEKVFPRLARLITEGRELGYVRSDLDAFVAATLTISLAEQIARPEFLLSLPIPPNQALQTVISVLLTGILSEEGRRLFDAVHFGSQNPVEVP